MLLIFIVNKAVFIYNKHDYISLTNCWATFSKVGTPLSTIEIFFSYSHKDETLREELGKQLSLLQWQGIITGWHDRKIVAGQEWKDEIDTHLNTARIILLLISPDFMASKYCFGVEVKRAMERHEQGEAMVIPVILRPVYWKGAPFGKLQALPTDAKAVTSSKWHDLDEAFFNVAEGIRMAIENLLARNEAEQWRRQGDRHFAQNNYVEALAAYEQAIRLDPNYASVYAIKGVVLSSLNRYQEALEACEQAIRLDPNSFSPYAIKGYALERVNRNKEAQQAFEKARQLGFSG